MLIVVYGTLKRGYGNNRILAEGDATFIKDVVVPYFKLYNSGFPVAADDEEASITGELWDIGDTDETQPGAVTLARLDMLEGEGRMYHRSPIVTECGTEAQMYVGHDDFWNFSHMTECPSEIVDEGLGFGHLLYTWSR